MAVDVWPLSRSRGRGSMGAVWAEIRAGGLRFRMLTTVEGVAMSSHLLEQSKEATILETVLVLRRYRRSVPYLTRKNAL